MSLPARHPLFRTLGLVIACLLGGAAPLVAASQSPGTPAGLPDEPEKIEQNETMLDTLKRMQIKREENDFRKLIEKAASIRLNAAQLESEMKGGEPGRLSRDNEKRLRDIEKSARQIRSESGGSDDGQPEAAEFNDAGMDELVGRLRRAGERLELAMAKTSRRIISVAVIEACSEVIELSRRIRLQGRQALTGQRS